jgi:hypothetical protein
LKYYRQESDNLGVFFISPEFSFYTGSDIESGDEDDDS